MNETAIFTASSVVATDVRDAAQRAAWWQLGDAAPRIDWFDLETWDERRYVGRWGHRDWDAFEGLADMVAFRTAHIWLRVDLTAARAIDAVDLLLGDPLRQTVRQQELDAQLADFYNTMKGITT